MARPRNKANELPRYCYRDRDNASRYFMLVPTPDGGRKRKSYGTDLHRMLADWADIYGPTQRAGDTVGATMHTYLGELAQRRAKGEIGVTTERDYQKHLASLKPVWEKVRWDDFDAVAIAAWQTARGAESTVQCNRELTVLAQLTKLAGRLGLIRDNPMRFIDRLRERPRDRLVTDADFSAVFKHANPPVRAAMFIASITGLRQGDILRLKRADFRDDGLHVLTAKTKKPIVYAWTEGLRLAHAMGLGVRQFAPLVHWLVTGKGKAYTSSGFRAMWNRALEKAIEQEKIERFTFNDLRAKAGSESRDWKLLGHLDQKTFERVYNRVPRRVEPVR